MLDENQRFCLACIGQAKNCTITRNGMAPEQAITYHRPWPRGQVAQGVMIDDMVIAAVVPRDGICTSPAAAEAADLLRSALRAYERQEVTDVPGKRKVHVANATVWGCEVRGAVGRRLHRPCRHNAEQSTHA